MLALLSIAGPISRLLQRADAPGGFDLSAVTSLLAIVVFIAFIAGVAYGFVAIPSQTQLQEDLPEDVRGRVFGILNMLVSVSSFLPIIIVGPISDFVGTSTVMLIVAIGVLAAGVGSVLWRDPNIGREGATADPHAEDPFAAALGMDLPRWREDPGAPASRLPVTAPDPVAVVDQPGPIGPRGSRLTSGSRCPGSRSSSPAARSAWASIRSRAATSRPSTARRSWPGRRASTPSPRSSRSIAGGSRRATSRSPT